MKKNLIFNGIIIIILLIGAIAILMVRNFHKEIDLIIERSQEAMPKVEGKKIVMIIAFQDFNDAEYFVPKEILEKAGVKIKTASNKKETAIGADGERLK